MLPTTFSFFGSLIMGAKSYFLKNKAVVIATGILLILVAALVFQSRIINRQRKELEVAAHNLAAANDSIRITKDNAGRIEANKLAYLFESIADLKEANKALYDEVKAVKGRVNTVIKGEIKVVEKEVPIIVKSELVDSTVTSIFNFDKTYSPGNYRKLSGFTKYNLKTGESTGEKTVDEIGIKLVTGIKNLDKGAPEIFIKSDYPGFVVTDLEGAVLDKNLFSGSTKTKIPLITVGVNIGWTPITYDWGTQKVDVNTQRIGATVGLNFNIGRMFRR